MLNPLGLVAAITTFLTVWFGHVAVRKIEFLSPTIWLPRLIFALLGIGLELAALFTVNRPWSMVLGIAGMTLIFDAFEVGRQQRRVRRGHAPANPNNPRHARILAEPGSQATTIDLLKREPSGRAVNPGETTPLTEHH